MNSNIFSFSGASEAETKTGSIRVAIQPGMSCKGWPTDAGSRALENYTALEDATTIKLLKLAGARIVGSTHMSELGFGLLKNTGNLAVLENLADLSLITDNMGEARIAAAHGGLSGFKPSYGIVSRSGLIGLIPSMECWGLLAGESGIIQSAMASICLKDEQDFSMTDEALPDFGGTQIFADPPGVIGVAEGYAENLTKTESLAWEKALTILENAGFRIENIKTTDPAIYTSVHNLIGSVEASSSAGKYDGVRYGYRASNAGNWNEMYLKSRGESFGTLLKAYLFQGAYFQFENYGAFENACRIRGQLIEETGKLFKQVDWIASLTIRENHDAFKTKSIEDIYKAFSFTVPANITGLPSLQIPGIALYENADFGLLITGRPLSDPKLLALGAYLGATKQGGTAK